MDKRIAASIGSPWIPQGRGLKGFDCYGYVLFVLDDPSMPECPFMGAPSDRWGFIQDLSKIFRKVKDRTPYGIVVMGKQGRMEHVGVYHPSGIVYHCLEGSGVVGHRLEHLGILGFDTKIFYKWESNANISSTKESV